MLTPVKCATVNSQALIINESFDDDHFSKWNLITWMRSLKVLEEMGNPIYAHFTGGQGVGKFTP